jgi:WXG100 family type VII secretion target
MTDIIKMDYGAMQEMAQIFQQGAQQLEETMREMQNVASTLEDGALLGQGGEAFSDAINGTLTQALNRLRDKYAELQQDILQAMRDMQDSDDMTERMY